MRRVASTFDTDEDQLDLAKRISTRFQASLRASALRLIDLGHASPDLYARVDAIASRRGDQKDGGGGTPRSERRLREYGPNVPLLFDQAVQAGRMSPRDAVDLLGVPFEDYRKLTELAKEAIDAR